MLLIDMALIDESVYQIAKCFKDNKLYAYNKVENLNMTEDYSIIKCFPLNDKGELVDKVVMIYRKDLATASSEKLA